MSLDSIVALTTVASARTPVRRRAALWMLGVVWCLSVGAGMGWLWKYAATPGGAAEPPLEWPPQSAVERVAGKATLVMLAHPHCSCSAASLSELEALMAQVHDLASAHVLFVRPQTAPEGWDASDLWSRAASIPGVTASWDTDATEAHRFGAITSGQTVVYDAAGRLLFHGGITGARGHVGDNVGRDRVVALLTGGHADRPESFVYGCSLEDHEKN